MGVKDAAVMAILVGCLTESPLDPCERHKPIRSRAAMQRPMRVLAWYVGRAPRFCAAVS